MLNNRDRSRGFRARKILADNGLAAVGGLLEFYREGAPPAWDEQSAHLRKRRAEFRREHAAKAEELRKTRGTLHEQDLKKMIASVEAAERASNEASQKMHAAKEQWDAQRGGLVKAMLTETRPILHQAFCMLLDAVETEEAERYLRLLADQLELPALRRSGQEPDGRVLLALHTVLCQALDFYYECACEVGLKLSRDRPTPPSRTLAEVMRGIG